MAPRSALSLLSPYPSSRSSLSTPSDSDSPTRRSHARADRDPTALESFSRTIRNYVPSSIPIPTAAPSPPRVSRPVSFGSFLSPATTSSAVSPDRERAKPSSPETWKRRGSDVSAAGRGVSDGLQRMTYGGVVDRDMPVFSLDDDIPEGRDGAQEDELRRGTRYPGVGDTEQVLWAGWDVLADSERPKSRTVLMLGYPTGLQLWDCSNLGSVAELLNLAGSQWGAVEFAGVLPDPPAASARADAFRQKRPLIAFSSRTVHGTDFLVYSLRSHEVVKRLPLIGFTSFAASSQFIVLSTSNPATLHILSSCTLEILYSIPSASLVGLAYPHSSSILAGKPNNNDDVVSSLDIDSRQQQQAPARPIYALSNRLLAYVAPLRRPSTAPPTSATGHTTVPVPAPDNTNALKLGLGMSQAELSNAAAKLGGSVLSGMRTLGGLAISAARAGVNAATEPGTGPVAGGGAGGFGARFFSKSAPATTASQHTYQTVQNRRRRSLRVANPAEDASTNALPPPPTSPVLPTTGCNVVIVDLHTLLSASPADPEPVAQFAFARPQALSALRFSADGTTLAVCAKDGHAVRVLQLRPAPRALRRLSQSLSHPADISHKDDARDVRRASTSSTATTAEPDAHLADSTQHVYTLRRGRTSAVVEGMAWAQDKLWFGMSTRKRTIHVFAVNPVGGKPDGSSHMAGRVLNNPELVSTSTELSPLVRVRLRPIAGEAAPAPCAFTFVRADDTILPASLLPPASVHFSASSSPSSVQSASGLSKPVSPAQRPTRPTNYRDMLVFDPADGALTLRRVFVERASADQAVVPGSIPIAGGMNISLPGMSTLSRSMGGGGTSASPPTAAGTVTTPRAVSGLTAMMERSAEIVGREAVVGTWPLARGRDWPEVKQGVKPARMGSARAGRVARSDWLSRAELSTFSSSPRILPRLIYLSHQFSFHLLGEDYHALIRSSHLDVPSTKIEVRRPVEVSAFATGDSDAFVHSSLSSPHDLGGGGIGGGVPSSFDEPLASALAAPLHPLHPSPPVLPMLPNGTPGSASKSFINAIPIRHVAAGIQDGMSGGLGRIRRELGKARSPRPNSDPVSGGGVARGGVGEGGGSGPTVPLEFDEEDEMDDFVGHAAADGAGSDLDVISRSTLMMGGDVGISVSAGTVGESGGSGSGSGSGSVSTPSTNIEPLPLEHDGDSGQAWQGWGPEDQAAVEDAERFDDITVGFLDEEQETMRAETEARKARARKLRRAGRRH
ncbi:hypothetical protein BD413DRAFT_494502 [Trametes elegans]|nr:hypothetical protein BD413DRAFT_494502 [Trametes elegans]